MFGSSAATARPSERNQTSTQQCRAEDDEDESSGLCRELSVDAGEAPSSSSRCSGVHWHRGALIVVGLCFLWSALLHKAVEPQSGPESAVRIRDEAWLASKAATVGSKISLFCWSHIQVHSYELSLVRLQLVKRANIFACEEPAVLSSTSKVLLGNINGAEVWTWYIPSEEVHMGTNGMDGQTTDSFLNTETFIFAWDALMSSGHMWTHDFVVKVDPDAVFLPDRLLGRVREHLGKPVYFSNCNIYGGEVLLYGSLEVFSVPALRKYEDSVSTCKNLPWQGWGEDYYMQHCMDALGVENVPDGDQVGDHRCVAADCDDYNKVAFHDFKDPQAWYDCFTTAISR